MFRTRTGCRGLDDPASPAAPRDVPVVLGASRSAGLRHELCRTFPPPPRCGTPRGWRWQEILSRAWLRDTKGKSAVSQSGGVTQRAASGSAVSCSCRAMLCSPHSPDLPLDAPFPETPLMRRKRRNGAGGALPRRRQLGDRFQDRRLRPLGHPPGRTVAAGLPLDKDSGAAHAEPDTHGQELRRPKPTAPATSRWSHRSRSCAAASRTEDRRQHDGPARAFRLAGRPGPPGTLAWSTERDSVGRHRARRRRSGTRIDLVLPH